MLCTNVSQTTIMGKCNGVCVNGVITDSKH